ncbi:MAG: UDP-N-acetylmuramoyl-tripeptide--D-alanyl-D-alanine ligase [Parachlamydia sp.]|nr:UDP-N-acetylmuramoyl-tripeptide--D-alanyl-D-alanine ligase [Parachlamydia sp.]
MQPFSIKKIARFFQQPLPSNESLIHGFSVDTRKLMVGNCYVALKGERVDGHAFLGEAKQQGAAAALVKANYDGPDFGLALIRVNDPLEALQDFAHSQLKDSKSRVVAVTGSVGKTTTKNFIHTLLSGTFKVAASPGNYNSQIGLPLTLLNHTSGDEDIVILEMGMTEAGQIARLIEIAPPEVAVLTHVALVHACNFDSLEAIAAAKSEILAHSRTQLGIVYRGIPYFDQVVKKGVCTKASFALDRQDADCWLDMRGKRGECNRESIHFPFDAFTLPGRHTLQNFLAAALVGRYFNLAWDEIGARIPLLALDEKRLQFKKKGGVLFLNDSYNASEISMQAALQTLPLPHNGGSRIAVFGSMLELGQFSKECHARVGEQALEHVERLYCLGEEWEPVVADWKSNGREAEIFSDHPSLISFLRNRLKADDVVLLKGSYSKEMWKVLEGL